MISCWSGVIGAISMNATFGITIWSIIYLHYFFLSFSSRSTDSLDRYLKTEGRWVDTMVDSFTLESRQYCLPIAIKLFHYRQCDLWTQWYQESLTFISFHNFIISMIFNFFFIHDYDCMFIPLIMNYSHVYNYILWLWLWLWIMSFPN